MIRFFVCLIFLIFTLSSAQAERRVALVMGNSAYENVTELKNPHNDARGMTEKLTSLGFDVTTGLDLSLRDMRQTVREFISKLEGADLALFFYAGHGLQVNGENYLVPVDARLNSYLDLDFEALPANLVLNAMEQTTRVNLVFLDACRNNPLAENLARSMGTRSGAVGRGLAKIGSGVGSLVSFATQPGNVALDGEGANSPFTTALLKHLGTPGQDVTRDLVMVRRDVLEATRGQQVPWDNSSLTGEVILNQLEMVTPPKPEPPKIDPRVELTYWDSIKSADKPAYFETYLKRYPEGQFADIARIRLDDLKATQEQAAAAANEPKRPDQSAEIAFWQSIQNATRVEMFQSYLDQYPNGIYARLAALKIDALNQMAEAEARAADAARIAAANAKEAEAARTNAAKPASDLTVAALTPDQTPAPAQAVTPSTALQLSGRDLVTALQTELNRVGCSVGRVDGDWGGRSRGALRAFGKEAGINLASLDPDASVLARLKASTGRVCPLTCGRNQELKNGSCVAVRKTTPDTGTSTKRKETRTASSCPRDPTPYGNKMLRMGRAGPLVHLTHPCGGKMECRGNRGTWNVSCRWQ